MRIFKSKWFNHFAKKEGIGDAVLRGAAGELEQGKWDANYGGDVYKKRIARQGEGKSGGYRTIVLVKLGERAFFVYGFAKNKLDNISQNELADYKLLAKRYLAETDGQLKIRLDYGDIIEIVQEA